ncbi:MULTISPECIES: chemotaxis protein CheD [unclassified Pseudomonas]|uniref:chemotaxis protein CheD n=1 Tax=unclassified Pseudomonas TaxID=196821 RepID=UPI002AC8A835|nr:MULTISPECIES: chemotaxis protein CheD [unclassified Pseudomonas]MEB0040803.1 chemotaxis protein CheD [Pseudomonas sp. MH10]MEB0076316.1 chemotaxis protein CheD [Pseudomonas sp. MH10out]MEB0093716.1 chemotaxis protein CheD [Pseudomonas sp. CCI4.2]MEB0101045.1 chemotaxis protein CheD [Pseudomonas sp. CCI3.2]MEB0122972.1 chemotaxis protein CheD [Pseudomonas sp. CCI1.2]
MNTPPGAIDLYLAPGQFHFSSGPARMRTLLGSCIAIILWHPVHNIGGLCHCMLPYRARRGAELDGRYVDEALALFQQEIVAHQTTLEEYQLKLFGGGEMFPEQRRDLMGSNVAHMNVAAAHELAAQSGLTPKSQDLGGLGHRTLIFDTWSGHVWVRHTSLKTAEGNDEKNKGTGRR